MRWFTLFFFPTLSFAGGESQQKLNAILCYGNVKRKKGVWSLLSILASLCLPELWKRCTPLLVALWPPLVVDGPQRASLLPGRDGSAWGDVSQGSGDQRPTGLGGFQFSCVFTFCHDFSFGQCQELLDSTRRPEGCGMEGWQIPLAMLIFSLGFWNVKAARNKHQEFCFFLGLPPLL